MTEVVVHTKSNKDKVLDLLRDKRWHTTYEITQEGGPEAMRRLRELRADGMLIEGRRQGNAQYWEYRLLHGFEEE